MTFSKTTFSITAFSIPTFSMTAFSIPTFSITTLNIMTEDKDTHYNSLEYGNKNATVSIMNLN